MPVIEPDRSPYESGATDAYYHRYRAHKIKDGKRVGFADLTPEELAEYDKGHEEEPYGRKDFG